MTTNMHSVWKHVMEYMQEHENFSEATVSIWFRDLQLEGNEGDTVFLSASELYKAEWDYTHFYDVIKNAVYETLGIRADLVFLNREDHTDVPAILEEYRKTGKLPVTALSKVPQTEEYLAEQPLTPEEKQKIDKPAGTLITSEIPPVRHSDGFTEEYTFDNFIVGETNKYAYQACHAIARNPDAEVNFNPLFLYSPSGLGKTHLLYAISNEITRTHAGKRVLYVKGSDFVTQFVDDMIVKKPMRYFREKYRGVDVLLVDDVHNIAGKEYVQEEFFQTFDALYSLKKQIILTSDRPPKDIKNLVTRLRTRFESGLMVDIQPPELELRVAIVKSKAKAAGIDIPTDVVIFIAENIKSSIRQLEGVVKRLKAHAFLYGEELNLELAKKCLNDLVPKDNVNDTVEKTFAKVTEKFNVTREDILSRRHNQPIVTARHVATYILRQITDLSSVEISRYFGQDHTTILSAIKTVEKKMDDNPELEDTIQSLIREIKE